MSVAVRDGRSPVPEETAGHGEDDGRDGECPDDQVDGKVDGGMKVFAAAEEEEHEEDNGVVDKGEEDL